MTKVVTIFNQKGGVGKTTTTVNLSTYISTMDKKVLVIDADPQGNATSGFGIEKYELKHSLYDAMVNQDDMEKVIVSTRYDNLDIIPSNVDLAGAEIELTSMMQRELRIKNSIELIKDNYDYIFIDCPPSLGLLSINALAASDTVLIPIQCEYYALEGVGQLMNTINLVKKSLNPNIDIEGVVLTMYDSRTNLSLQVVDEVTKYFREKVFNTLIPRNVRLAESPSHGLTIREYDSRSRGAIAYQELAKEFIAR